MAKAWMKDWLGKTLDRVMLCGDYKTIAKGPGYDVNVNSKGDIVKIVWDSDTRIIAMGDADSVIYADGYDIDRVCDVLKDAYDRYLRGLVLRGA